ncbi:MAG TPA: amidohydrolase family protein [Acidimicrobiia bacterium]|jgi:predicted TIM-barrel fold metal-dependent hydrolase|nr:amidohydrolase family protein [Acidimicrobiia bacterium]
MLPDDAPIISFDDHVIEHADVWTDRLPAQYRDAGPRTVIDDDGIRIWTYEGRRYQPLGLDAVAGDDPEEFKLTPKAFEDMRPGCYDPVARLADMDEDGVHASISFPQFPRFAGQTFVEADDKELALRCVQAWNDFVLDEWSAVDTSRLVPLSILPMWDPQLCATEIRRVVEKGSKAVTFSENPAALGLPSFWSEAWSPMLAALEDTDTPMCLHIGSSSRPIVPHEDAPIPVVISLLNLLSMTAMSDLVFSPIFNRHPRLKVVLAECGIGWIPWMLERLEATWTKQRHHSKINTEKTPRECFRDNMWACFIQEQAGIELRHHIGVDKILCEVDYPHSDTTWPNSRAWLRESLADVPDDEARRIAGGNAAKLLKLAIR